MKIIFLIISLFLSITTLSCKSKDANSDVDALRYNPKGENKLTAADVRKYLVYRTAMIEGLQEISASGSSTASSNKRAFAEAVNIMFRNMISGIDPVAPIPFIFAGGTGKPQIEWQTELKPDEEECYVPKAHGVSHKPECKNTIVGKAADACGVLTGKTLCEIFYWWIYAANGRKCLGLSDKGVASDKNPCTADHYSWSSSFIQRIAKVRYQNQVSEEVVKNYEIAMLIEAVLAAIGRNQSDNVIDRKIEELSKRPLTRSEISNIIDKSNTQFRN